MIQEKTAFEEIKLVVHERTSYKEVNGQMKGVLIIIIIFIITTTIIIITIVIIIIVVVTLY